ncbi:MAG TPA: 23S rRNA pseudouridine(955/2504/2580) synthase RluC [Porticoccaceae bacterium]|nr:23S rRNA pseudouridine(955/2504/2580) synthase RluC [Porticoccaceae bacterium]HCO58666.1 23S rRNA pseudouridine(955/2504/2580) synthase RluC [Porticoccaceae bacterium]
MTGKPQTPALRGGQAPQKVRFIVIDKDTSGQRIDNFLLARLKGVPKSRVYRLLRKGEVRVNKGRIRPDYRLCVEDVVRVPPIRVAEREPTPVPGRDLRDRLADNILYEDEACLVINKPPGLAVHGGSGINLGLVEALRAMRPKERRLELVHRIDRDTSGCLLLARKRSALVALQDQMRQRLTEKRYLALVKGRWPNHCQEVNAPLLKTTTSSGERIVRISKQGKSALTRFAVVQHFSEVSLIEAQLETGRTHQIRVHCQSQGHPLVGDEKYGDDNFNQRFKKRGAGRLCLHAKTLGFRSPATGEKVVVEAPLPADLQGVLERLA